MSEFMSMYNLKNVIKHKTCFTNPENPNSHKLIVTVLKHYPPPPPPPPLKKRWFLETIRTSKIITLEQNLTMRSSNVI